MHCYSEGLSFLNKQRHVPPQSSSCPLPSHCFVSAEAATWVQRNVAGVHSLMQSLQLLQVKMTTDFNDFFHSSLRCE